METLKDWIDKIALAPSYALIGTGVIALLAGLKKPIAKAIEKLANYYIDKAFGDLQEPEDKKLFLAIIKWVEVKVPGKKEGSKKFDLATDKIIAMVPALRFARGKLRALIEAAVVSLDDTLKDNIQEDRSNPSRPS